MVTRTSPRYRAVVLAALVASLVVNVVLFALAAVKVRRRGARQIKRKLRELRTRRRDFADIADEQWHELPTHNGIVFLGDSQAAGAPMLEMFTPYRQRGIHGALIEDALCWVDPLLDEPVERVVTVLGTNDVWHGRGVERIVADMTRLLDHIAARQPACRVAVASVPPMPSRIEEVRAANASLAKLCVERGCDWIDLTPVLESMTWTADGVHLTTQAYLQVAPLLRVPH